MADVAYSANRLVKFAKPVSGTGLYTPSGTIILSGQLAIQPNNLCCWLSKCGNKMDMHRQSKARGMFCVMISVHKTNYAKNYIKGDNGS